MLRSVVAKVDIASGTVLNEDLITTMRPLTEKSVPAYEYYNVIGKILKKSIGKNELVNWEDISC